MPAPLRLMIYDQTCRGHRALPGLSHAWSVGGRLYAGLDHLDACQGVVNWEEGLRFLAEHRPECSIGEIQFWGHGQWGQARVGKQVLDRGALEPGHAMRPLLEAVRARLCDDALWWFRTCETFGAQVGQDFASAWTDFFEGRAAGHTHIIALWQSGLHGLCAGARPDWSSTEGIAEGSPTAPRRARHSLPWSPNTITCLDSRVPEGWFASGTAP